MIVFRFVATVLVCSVTVLSTSCATHPGKVEHVRFASDAERVVAVTRAGPVRGVQGSGVRAFLGVPYAAPPVADSRWRAPQPSAPWRSVRDAIRIGSDCTQALGRKAILGGGGGPVVVSTPSATAWTRASSIATSAPSGAARRWARWRSRGIPPRRPA